MSVEYFLDTNRSSQLASHTGVLQSCPEGIRPHNDRLRMRPVHAQGSFSSVQGLAAEPLYSDALDLVGETGYSYYDCLILAAAIESGAGRLLTEDLQNGRKVRSLEVVNPFA